MKVSITTDGNEVTIEVETTKGLVKGSRSAKDYDSDYFNYGYGGQGPHAMMAALVDILYCCDMQEKIENPGLSGIEVEGVLFVKKLVKSDWKKPDTLEIDYHGAYEFQATEEQISMFPFLNQKEVTAFQ